MFLQLRQNTGNYIGDVLFAMIAELHGMSSELILEFLTIPTAPDYAAYKPHGRISQRLNLLKTNAYVVTPNVFDSFLHRFRMTSTQKCDPLPRGEGHPGEHCQPFATVFKVRMILSVSSLTRQAISRLTD